MEWIYVSTFVVLGAVSLSSGQGSTDGSTALVSRLSDVGEVSQSAAGNGEVPTNETESIILTSSVLSTATQLTSHMIDMTVIIDYPQSVSSQVLPLPSQQLSIQPTSTVIAAESTPIVVASTTQTTSDRFVVSVEIKSSALPSATLPSSATQSTLFVTGLDELSTIGSAVTMGTEQITSNVIMQTVVLPTMLQGTTVKTTELQSTEMSDYFPSTFGTLLYASTSVGSIDSTPTVNVDKTSFVVTAPVWDTEPASTFDMSLVTPSSKNDLSSVDFSTMIVQPTFPFYTESIVTAVTPTESYQISNSLNTGAERSPTTVVLTVQSTELLVDSSTEESIIASVISYPPDLSDIIQSTTVISFEPSIITETLSVPIASVIATTEPDNYTAIVSTPPPTTPPSIYTLRVSLKLTGNCSVLEDMTSTDQLAEFKANLVSALNSGLSFPSDKIVIKSIKCGSVIAVIHFLNVTGEMDLEESLESLEAGTELFSVLNGTYIFSIIQVDVIPEAPSAQPKPTIASRHKKLTDIQIIVIIVCSVVGGSLILYAVGFCIYACYQKKKSKSFDLGETPVSTMHMEDFTLTKMQRPPSIYTEHGLVIPRGQNSKAQAKRNGQYQPIDDEMQCIAPDDIHLADTLPRRTSADVQGNDDVTITTQHIQQMEPHTSAGFDNPSFSSDDILDSGAENDVPELPMDLKPTSHSHVIDSEFQQDEVQVVPPNNYPGTTKDHMKGDSATAF